MCIRDRDYREDVYRVVKAYADTKPSLKGEAKRLLEQTLRDYRRAGLHLAKAERDEVEALRKELAAATTEFRTNITNAKKSLKFTKAELEGLPESFLEQVKTGDDEYTLQANVTFHYLNILRSAKGADAHPFFRRATRAGQRQKCAPAKKGAATPRRDRQQARIRDVGRLPL